MPSRRRWLVRGTRFALLTLVTELTGRSITVQLDRAFHVLPLAAPQTPGYPLLLAGVRSLAALTVAAAVWRLMRAHATACAGERVLQAVGGVSARTPRLRVRLSPRLWLLSFGATALWFLAQNDLEQLSDGRWPLLAPWLHTYALPVFAVLSVVIALGWNVVGDWVSAVERYAATTATCARVCGLRRPSARLLQRVQPGRDPAPRQLFGLDFESRPPPLPA